MPIAELDALKIYYEEAGTGPRLFFISGSGGDLRNKPNQFDSPLARAYSLISYDQRGLGQSDNPPGDFSMRQYADDAARLLDHLGIDRIPMMGVSFGGMVGLELLLQHPDRISAAVLACTSAGGAGGSSYPLHEIQHLPARERAETHLRVSDLRHTQEWINANPEAWEKRVQMVLKNQRPDRDEAGAIKQLEARRYHDTFDRLGEINAPVLLAGGRYDGVAPVQNMQAIHERIAASTLEFFEGGHMFLVQDKSAYPAIMRWLSGVLSDA